jgi:RimJ/RimL family protein N-acetyltransferase
VADAGTDEAVGQVGLWLDDAGQGSPSVGYWVVASARGAGAAASAVTAVAHWAHDGQAVGGTRRDMYMYARLTDDAFPAAG